MLHLDGPDVEATAHAALYHPDLILAIDYLQETLCEKHLEKPTDSSGVCWFRLRYLVGFLIEVYAGDRSLAPPGHPQGKINRTSVGAALKR